MKLKVSNQQIIITEPLPLVSDTENVYEAEYEFGEEWEGYQRTAVFEGCGASYQVVLTSTNKCKIPNEILAESGYVRFGVLGTKVEGSITLRYPTVWTDRVFVDVASVGTGTPTPPTAEVYAQILANEEALEEDVEALDGRLDTAESDIDTLESGKVDKVDGKGLSTNDYTDNEKLKVDSSYLAKHTHENMSILNAISQVLVEAWNGAVTWISNNGTNLLNHLSNTTVHVSSAEKETWNAKANPSDIPTKTSQLTNDSGFIDNTVNNLVNYYLKNNLYNKSEVDALIGAITRITFEVVDTLPTASASTMNKIYLVPATSSSVGNVKDEYITIESSGTYSWELIGSTSVDLSNYYTKSETNAQIATATTDMATKTWVGSQGYLTSSALSGYATEAWVTAKNYITNSVSDLANYYLKSEVYTKTEIDTTVNDLQSKTDNSLYNLDEQGRVVQSILAVDTKTHTHSNKSILDTIGSDAGGLYWED